SRWRCTAACLRASRRSASRARLWPNTTRARRAASRLLLAAPAIEEQDLLQALRAPHRARGAVEEHVEEHVVGLVVAPGPGLLVAGREGPDLSRPAEQPLDVVARHPDRDLREVGLGERLVDLLHALVGAQGDDEGL